jgi:Aminopeptidase N
MAEMTHFYETFQPTHYNVYLEINRQNKQISGLTTITGDAKQETISIHQKDLLVDYVQLNGKRIRFVSDNQADAIRINLGQTGNVTLTISYRAKLTDSMMGIYPSYYEVDGVQKQVIGTQFETNFARQASPALMNQRRRQRLI